MDFSQLAQRMYPDQAPAGDPAPRPQGQDPPATDPPEQTGGRGLDFGALAARMYPAEVEAQNRPEEPPAASKAPVFDADHIRDPDIVPTAPDGYDLHIESADPAAAEWFRSVALEQGLSRRQAAQLAAKYDAMAREQAKAEDARYREEAERIRIDLSRVWGVDTAAKVKALPGAVAHLERSGVPGLSAWIKNEALGAQPMLARLVHMLAEARGFKAGSGGK